MVSFVTVSQHAPDVHQYCRYTGGGDTTATVETVAGVVGYLQKAVINLLVLNSSAGQHIQLAKTRVGEPYTCN